MYEFRRDVIIAKAQILISSISTDIEKISDEKFYIISDLIKLIVCLLFVLCILVLLVIVYSISRKYNSINIITKTFEKLKAENYEEYLEELEELKNASKEVEKICKDESLQNKIDEIKKVKDCLIFNQ